MTTLVVLSVAVIVFLIAVLAIYLFVVGVLLNRIADNLDNCNESVQTIVGHGQVIIPAVEHINRVGGNVAGALPLLYGHAERIVAKKKATDGRGRVHGGGVDAAVPPSGRRRSRLADAVGFRPSDR